jgi:hypothetical protein
VMPDDDECVRVAPAVHVREFDGQLIILDLDQGDYFGLDEVGTRMWSELALGKSARQVAELLAAEYEIDVSRVLSDVRALISNLLERGLVVRSGEGGRDG